MIQRRGLRQSRRTCRARPVAHQVLQIRKGSPAVKGSRRTLGAKPIRNSKEEQKAACPKPRSSWFDA